MNHEEQDTRPYASPTCYQHELDDVPVLSAEEIAGRLNELLEGERAGARGLIDMKAASTDPALADLLDAVARDEARFCAMLGHHLSRLGHTPSRKTGVFYEKLKARETLEAQLKLLDRGQSAVVRMLEEILPSVRDPQLLADLTEMRDVHVENIRRCAEYPL